MNIFSNPTSILTQRESSVRLRRRVQEIPSPLSLQTSFSAGDRVSLRFGRFLPDHQVDQTLRDQVDALKGRYQSVLDNQKREMDDDVKNYIRRQGLSTVQVQNLNYDQAFYRYRKADVARVFVPIREHILQAEHNGHLAILEARLDAQRRQKSEADIERRIERLRKNILKPFTNRQFLRAFEQNVQTARTIAYQKTIDWLEERIPAVRVPPIPRRNWI